MQSRLSAALGIVAGTLAVFAACANASNNGFSEADAGTSDATNIPGVDAPISVGVDTGSPSQPDTGNGTTGEDGEAGNPGTNEAGVCTTDPPSNKCGVAPQCGCEATETCDLADTTGDVACIAAGTAAQGQTCTTTAGCARGLTCFGDVCRPFCPAGKANAAACGVAGTSVCLYATDAMNNAIPNYHVCQLACDLAVGTCGADDMIEKNVGCILTDAANDTDCYPMGAGANGASCTDASSCKPGFLCVSTSMDAAAPGTCRQWCKLVGGTCGTGTCNELNPKVIVNAIEYGECE